MALLIEQTFSQRTWPKAGDVDDCWVVSTIQCANVVAPWLPLLDTTEFRKAAGDPDDGKSDGGNIDEIIEGISTAYPLLAPLVTACRGWNWDAFLKQVKAGRVATVAVVSSRLPLPYGFSGLHQVTYFHEPAVGLRIANPLAPDRSQPTRIATLSAKTAAEAFGNGKVWAVLFPTIEEAFRTHPLYVPESEGKYTEEQLQTAVAAAKLASDKQYQGRIVSIREKVMATAVDVQDD